MKSLDGVVVSTKMKGAVIVEVTRRIKHPKYKKLLKRSKRFSVSVNGHTVHEGDRVTIAETKPVSKTIHFAISKVYEK